MTIFSWTKEDIENILKDIDMAGESNCCSKHTVIEDLQSILETMKVTEQKYAYVAPRQNRVYLTGRNPEAV